MRPVGTEPTKPMRCTSGWTSKKNHAALPYAEIPQFVAKLRQQDGVAALALEFVVLTAVRSGEAIGAQWPEFNVDEGVWTIPPGRMKADVEHRVPLSGPALAIIRAMAAERTSDTVFPKLAEKAMYDLLQRMQVNVTVHGFRSSFRDWAAEQTTVAREVAEAALAHAIQNKVEAAYRRSDLFGKRRKLMDDWGRYCIGSDTAGVVPLRRPATN